MDYKKILEGVVDIINTTEKSDIGFANICAYIGENFPELRESEDEQHRKWVLEYLYDGLRKSDERFKGQFKCAIVWLEKQRYSEYELENEYWRGYDDGKKQGEKKPADKVEPKFKVGDKIQYLKGCGTIMTIEKIENGEYIFGNNLGHTTIEDGNKWYLVERNPTWSEEDESRITTICTYLQDYARLSGSESRTIRINEYCAWLKSLNSQSRWKPSEQEKAALRTAIRLMTKERSFPLLGAHLQNILDAFEGESRVDWKPSKGQMEALKEACNEHYNPKGELYSLYEQLKAL